MPRSRFIGVLKFGIFLGIGLLFTWLSLRGLTSDDKIQLLASFKEANFFWIIIVVLIGITSHVIRSLRWMMLLESAGYKPSLKNTFLAVMTGYFANLAFPRLGELTRCGVLLTTDDVPVNRSFGTVITERAIDLITFAILFFLVIAAEYNLLAEYLNERMFPGLLGKIKAPAENITLILLIIFFIVIFVISLLFIVKAKPEQKLLFKVKNFLVGFWKGLISVGKISKPTLFVLYTILLWVCYFLMTWLVLRALPETAHLSVIAGLSILVLGNFGIMATPGGIGLYPLIAMETMTLYGIKPTVGLAMGWISWSAQTVMIIVTGTGALLWYSQLKKKKQKI